MQTRIVFHLNTLKSRKRVGMRTKRRSVVVQNGEKAYDKKGGRKTGGNPLWSGVKGKTIDHHNTNGQDERRGKNK